MEPITLLYWAMLYLIGIFFTVVIPAAFNISLGLRDKYIQLLYKVFEFGYDRMKKNNNLNEAASGIIDHNPGTPGKSPAIPKNFSFRTLEKQFHLGDICEICKDGMEVIMEDEVTKRFSAAELPSWNLLTRTNVHYQFISLRLTIIWALGFFVRYFIFLPVRLSLVVLGFLIIFISMALAPHISNESTRKTISNWGTLLGFRILARGISAVVRFHNRENMAQGGGLCVANHTSPLDAILLACDRNYALIGQMQGGIMGMMQKALLKAQDHIFFERGEMKDRMLVVRRMREHVEDPNKNPILIFPEGTCINNTSVMMFKKGSFEVGGTIYPVAIKYDATFGNAFWNSMKEPMLTYLINMMTSWAIVCDVWYMPPTEILENENAIMFANRVKSDIAKKGGLVDLVWDGGLKRASVPTKLKEQEQKKYAKNIKTE